MYDTLNTPRGWQRKALSLRDPDGHPKLLDIFSFERSAKIADNKPNGDTFGISYSKAKSTLRIAVADGVTDKDRPGLPDGFTNPAVYASRKSVEVLASYANIPKGFERLHKELHSSKLGVNSPRASVAAVSVDSFPYAERLVVGMYIAGDCEIYTYRNRDGWEKELNSDMLTAPSRQAYQELQQEFIPILEELRIRYGQVSKEFQNLFQEFYQREQEILGDSQSWISPPLGRYDISELNQSQLFRNDSAFAIDGILITTDGAQLNCTDLNKLGPPRNISEKTFDDRYEGWNDMAAVAVGFSRD